MKLALRLTCQPTPPREASAYFVPGGAAEAWLAELTAWQTPLAKARLHVIPDAQGDRTPCGVLVLGATPPASRRSPRALPYGVVAGRLYLPVDAKLDPPVDGAELGRLLAADDSLYLWRPQTGLVELPASRSLAVSDLLLAPEAVVPTWDRGVAGVAFNARLFSIEPEAAPTVESVLEAARDDIGSEPLDLKQLPPAANEPRSGIGGAVGRGLMQVFAGALYGLTRLVPHTGAVRNWINQVEDWAGAKLNKLAQSLEASRHRELNRLLDMLRTNPDEGLRYALPMSGGEHRGLALPSGRLARRNVDFSLNWFRGGGPADVWEVSGALRMRLLTSYRELAAREIALGRHRRAAYIFATLLGDEKSAANTLADGGHWREAAVLYEQRLNQPREAARCLQQGGLWAEAIALYEKLGEHETVGDLYQQLEQRDEAEQAWRRAVAACDARNDPLDAARLLEHKISRIDEAWQRLLSAWPRSSQAALCMTEAFKLLARHGWHERAAALVDELVSEPADPQPEAAPIELVAAQALEYPEATVRQRAADRTRVAAAKQLDKRELPTAEAKRMALAVGRLAPDDRLLARDAQRWLLRRLEAPRVAKPPVFPRGKLALAREFALPSLDWRAAVATEDALYAAGFRDREVVLVRVSWRAALDPRWGPLVPPGAALAEQPGGSPWRVEPRMTESPILLTADPFDRAPVIMHVLGYTSLAARTFVANERFPGEITAGGHRGLSAFSVGVGYAADHALHVADITVDGTIVINSFLSKDAQLRGLASLKLKAGPRKSPDVSVRLLARKAAFCAAIDDNLWFFGRGRSTDVVSLPGVATQLVDSAPHTRARIAVAMEQGGLIVWGDDAAAPQTPFASEMVEPRIALTRGGYLVAASKDEIDVYATGGGELTLHARMPGNGAAPLAVLASSSALGASQFAIVYLDGRVAIYRTSPA